MRGNGRATDGTRWITPVELARAHPTRPDLHGEAGSGWVCGGQLAQLVQEHADVVELGHVRVPQHGLPGRVQVNKRGGSAAYQSGR